MITVYDVPSGRELRSKKLSGFTLQTYRTSPDGKLLAVVGRSTHFLTGEVRLLDLDSLIELLPPLEGHVDNVFAVAFSPDGQRLATGGSDKTVIIWDLATGQKTLSLKGHTNAITSLQFVSDGRRLMSAGADETVRVWDATPLPE